MADSSKRSVVKTFTWRMLATFTTFVISWAITGNIYMGLGIASIEFWAKLVLYYLHERGWNKIKWGKNETN